jgi:hypothetical protein
MTNELTNYSSDNFALAAASANNNIVGERLRFSKGLYLIGKGDADRLPIGTQLNACDMQVAWTKFVDGRVVDQRVGYPVAQRDDLGDHDPQYWDAGFDGKPADPWALQNYLYLVDPEDGREFTFVTSSWGGRAEVGRLARQIYVKRQFVPGAVPIIRLEVGQRRSPKYGNVPAPRFEIVAWEGNDNNNNNNNNNNNTTNNGGDTRSLGRDLDDEIPF